jgi:thymidylate synthase
MNRADERFIKMCEKIFAEGTSTEGTKVRTVWDDGTPAHTVKIFGVTNRYDLSKEFPMQTLRPVPWKNAIDELLWIWQKKSNNVNELGSHIWDAWADEKGSIGKAYGYQLGVKYDFGGGRIMDQVDNILWQLKNTKNSRRMLTNIYNFSDLTQMGLEPCAYSMSFNVTGNKLNGILNQRSQDILTANAWNVCQYAALVHMFAQVSGFEVGEFLHVICDAHIYDRHIPLVKELIKRESFPAPKFKMNKDVKDFYDFQITDFAFEDYRAGEQIKGIPVAV